MSQILLPRSLTAPPAFVEEEPELEVDPAALIKEARRRQRRRRLAVFAVSLLVAGIGTAVWQIAAAPQARAPGTSRLAAAAVVAPTLEVHLVGWGTVIQSYVGRGLCPDGKTLVAIRSLAGKTIGSVIECDLLDGKVDKPNWGVRSTRVVTVATYALPGGTIITREQRTFLFARDQIHTTGTFRGRIVTGSGRFAHLRGTAWGAITRSSCRGEFVLVDEAAE